MEDAVTHRKTAQRRMGVVGGHLIAQSLPAVSDRALVELELQQSRAVASVPDSSGMPSSSYQRVHGDVSQEPARWTAHPSLQGQALKEVAYAKAEGVAKVTINRPHKRNAFTPLTVTEMGRCMTDAQNDPSIGVIILTGQGPAAFCSGGDQSVRGHGGYVGADAIPRLNVLDLQLQIRRCPKPVIAMVAGYAVGGGHVLHMVCDLTISADNGMFGQTGPKVGSFDAGYGSAHMARLIGKLCPHFTPDMLDSVRPDFTGRSTSLKQIGKRWQW